MQRMPHNPQIDQLIKMLARLPGLGPRSARRAALHLIKKKETLLQPLTLALSNTAENIKICSNCYNIDTSNPCFICCDPQRDQATLIVVEDVSDLWALERAGVLYAKYHVLGGCLAPLDGLGPDDLNIGGLLARLKERQIKEIILAMNATVEGQTTEHYLTKTLGEMGVKISRLAHGVPIGGELDYLDDGTLAQALRARTFF